MSNDAYNSGRNWGSNNSTATSTPPQSQTGLDSVLQGFFNQGVKDSKK